jgi:hypothetical protein
MEQIFQQARQRLKERDKCSCTFNIGMSACAFTAAEATSAFDAMVL